MGQTTFENWDVNEWRAMVDALDDLTLEELRELARIFKMNFRDETRLTKQDIILVLDEVNPGPLKDAVAAVRRRR